MFQTVPPSPQDVLNQYHARYDADISSGKYEPFVYPWGTFGAAVAMAYLLIPHRHSQLLRRARFLAWLFIACFAVYTIRNCRARNSASAFSVGLMSAWSILWCATILIVHDAQTDFRRIERTEGGAFSFARRRGGSTSANGTPQKIFISRDNNANGDVGLHPCRKRNDHAQTTEATPDYNGLGTEASPAQRTGRFAWQPYPISPFIERLDWVADIFCNFRGMGWNWRISGLPPPPKWVQEQLRDTSGQQVSEEGTQVGKVGAHRYHTKKEMLRVNIRIFILGYLALDLLKALFAHDKYFWGFVDQPGPAYLPEYVRQSPVLLRTYRLVISLAAVYASLQTLFAMAPLLFIGVFGTKRIGARGEPWMYPDYWGSYRHVFNKGLAGWWGSWWHQTFRFAFETPSKHIVKALGMNPRSLPAKSLQLIIAFSLSGSIHGSASITLLGDTDPLRGPFLFFFSQAFGIMAQIIISSALKKAGISQKIPKLVRQVVNFIYVHVWFYYTAPLLCDDFARGGLWLYEPIPISPLRGLGFGAKEGGWWCWGGEWVRWHTGKHWWQSGLAL